jgi:hypothetical protein
MPQDTVYVPNLTVQGSLQVAGNMPSYPRTNLAPDTNQILPLPFHIWRQAGTSGFATTLAAASSGSDLGLYTGTFGTAGNYIGTNDVKTTTVNRSARCNFTMPPEYVGGTGVSVRFSAGCITTIADTLAVIALDVRLVDRYTGTVSANLYTGASLSIRSTTFADIQFPLTTTALLPGSILDIKATISMQDAASGTAVIGAWRAAEIYTTIKG